MEGSQINKDEGELRKIIRETFKKDLEINGFDRDMIYVLILFI